MSMGFHDRQEFAVCGRSLTLRYKGTKGKVNILQSLDITVRRGRIYGLLGPSGCGKTTLLKCILGQLTVDKGQIVALGNIPGTPGHGIPGSLVGYMPQEIGLFNLLTIGETLRYFGRIHGLNSDCSKKRIEFMLDLLSLPEEDTLIDNLSIGQKRRVSFSIALLHKPDLLILDEPTVGVDPVLRERIWDHLINLSNGHLETTIIITTHYIEEARQADMVGLMRNGKLLAEEKPLKLMNFYKLNTLEAVFLKLCNGNQPQQPLEELTNCNLSKALTTRSNKQRKNSKVNSYRKKRQTTADQGMDETDSVFAGTSKTKSENDNNNAYGKEKSDPSSWCSKRNLNAQCLKNLTQIKKNMKFLTFMILFPSIQIILFCTCFGTQLYDLPVSIANEEITGYSHKFLEHLDSSVLYDMKYTNLSTAIQSVKDGKSFGVISISKNFTLDLFNRFMNNGNASQLVVEGSQIKLHLDMTNPQISLTIYQSIMKSFEQFCTELLQQFQLNPSSIELPVMLSDPVYGRKDFLSLTAHTASGIMLSITFAMATASTILNFVTERREGLLTRTLVSGVTAFEIMLAHMLTQLILVFIQIMLVLAFMFYVFDIPHEGPLIWVIILALCNGFCGMTLGAFISSICDEEKSALQLALGSVYPVLLLGGIIWPLQAIPTGLRHISMCLPVTYGSEAIRAVLLKGWDITYMVVWRGYAVSFVWSCILLTLTAIILRLRRVIPAIN